MVNLVLAQRRKGQLPTVSLEDLAVQPSGGAIDHQVAHEMDARQLLQSLTDDDLRQPILLRYYAELKVPEIAKVLGVPEGTVKSRLHRAMGLLRREAKRGAVG